MHFKVSKHLDHNKHMDKRACNFHNELWSVVRSCRNILNLAQSEHAIDDFAKDDVLPVEEIARCGRDEELYKSC
jgi:hypothetical protein